jgi:hypothetical protein
MLTITPLETTLNIIAVIVFAIGLILFFILKKEDARDINKLNYWAYKTKCRVCGNHTIWHLSPLKFKYVDLLTSVNDYIREPRQMHCDKCKAQTVQDIVQYSENKRENK